MFICVHVCACECVFTWIYVRLEASCWCQVSSPVAVHLISVWSRFHESSSILVGWVASELHGSTCLCLASLPAPGVEMCITTLTFCVGGGDLSPGPLAGTAGASPTKPARSPHVPVMSVTKNTNYFVMFLGISLLVEDFYCFVLSTTLCFYQE